MKDEYKLIELAYRMLETLEEFDCEDVEYYKKQLDGLVKED